MYRVYSRSVHIFLSVVDVTLDVAACFLQGSSSTVVGNVGT